MVPIVRVTPRNECPAQEVNFRLLRQQPMAVDDGCRDVGELGVGPARLVAQHLEGVSVVDQMTLHQDALGSLGDRAATERALEVVVLGEPAKHDVDGALPVVDSASVI